MFWISLSTILLYTVYGEMTDIDQYLGAHEAQPRFIGPTLAPCRIKHFVLYDQTRNKPVPIDTEQGKIGNCFFSQTLTAIAIADPDILMRNIRTDDISSGSFTVRFYDGPLRKPVEVGVNLAKTDCAAQIRLREIAHTGELIVWPLIYEKAFAKYLDWKAKKDPKGAKLISDSVHSGEGYERMNDGGHSSVAMSIIMGKSIINYNISRENPMKTFMASRAVLNRI